MIARKLFINGILGIIDTGLICTIGANETPDGGWYKSTTVNRLSVKEQRNLEDVASLEEMSKTVTIAIVTKANYWMMNHHTGQSQVARYVKKVGSVLSQSSDRPSCFCCIGYYASTLKVLEIADVRRLRVANSFVIEDDAIIRLSNDTKLCFQSLPAGTHRLVIAYEAAKRLVRSVYATFYPSVQDFRSFPTIRQRILENPVRYHIGASYLIGESRIDYQDTDMNHYLGRFGTFITIIYKQSTLAKSHLAIAKMESYNNYDADFKAILGCVQIAQAAARGRLVEEQI